MTRWETAGLPQLGEVVAAGDCTVAAGEGGLWRTDQICLAPIPVIPFPGFKQVSSDINGPTRVYSLGMLHFPNSVHVVNSWLLSLGDGDESA